MAVLNIKATYMEIPKNVCFCTHAYIFVVDSITIIQITTCLLNRFLFSGKVARKKMTHVFRITRAVMPSGRRKAALLIPDNSALAFNPTNVEPGTINLLLHREI